MKCRKRILILIGQHLSNAPRPQKEALALAKAGFDVTISGAWSDELQAQRDRDLVRLHGYCLRNYLDMRPKRISTRAAARMGSKLTKIGWSYCGYVSPSLIGYGVRHMERFARRFRADLTIAHCEGALWVCRRLHRLGYRVGVDFEDWFSRDLLEEARKARPIAELNQLERYAFKNSSYQLTTSDVMANALAREYRGEVPTTIYNVFPKEESEQVDGERKDRITSDRASLHWFSQTAGPGRGLEEVCDAVATIREPFELHFRGQCDPAYRDSLLQRLRKDQQKFFRIHDTVSNSELPSRIAEHDIGLGLEQHYCDSRNLTITNKFFQYLQGGLAVVASNTLGQEEAVRKGNCGTLVDTTKPGALREALEALIRHKSVLARQKEASLGAARSCFSWEHMEPIVVARAKAALGEG